MCGRYTVVNTGDLAKRFHVSEKLRKSLAPNYNVAPGQTMPVIVNHGHGNTIELMHWGLIPVWAKDMNIGYKMINAKAETLDEKPTWKRPLKKQRCLVPASGFYEWKKNSNGKTPYYIHLKNNELFAFAGLYDVWHDPEGEEIKSYAIITTKPNHLMGNIHDRMPALLDKKDEDSWIDESVDDVGYLENMLKPYNDAKMDAYVISAEVNKPSNNYPSLLHKLPSA